MTNFGDMVIYDIHGSKLLDAILTEGAVLERELGKTDVVKLSWKSDKKSTLPVGSYIVPFSDGLKYRLLDDYTPSEDSTCVKYEPAFNHPLAILSRIPFLYDTTDQDGNPIKQQEWPYDGLTTNALEYACKAINEALGITDESKKFTYTLCGTVDTTISFSVSSNDILSVLSSMAQACKNNSSEWHLSWEDHTLYFGQIFINLGEKIPLLKVHDNINFATVNSSNEPYYNCFYPQGSSRNMSRKAQVGLGNVATLVRLGLNRNKFPDGCIYVDKDSNVITKDAFVQSGAVKQMVALSFDDVYPHIDLYAYNVRPRYRYLKNRQTNEIEKDASGKNKVYTTWYMRLAYPTTVKDDAKTLVNTTNDIDEHGKLVTHYWYDYELNVKEQVLQGHTLKATFKVNTHATDGKYDALTQSLVGQPNGQDGFELAYFDKNNAKEIPSNHYNGDSGVNIKAGDYEIKFYQSGDVIIPTNQEEGLYPRGNNLPDLTCNIVVLFNIKQGQKEIASAQEELAKRTEKEIGRRFKDNNNYTFSSNPVAFEEKNPKLHIGQKVIFNDGQGYELSTRVIKIESKIDFPFIQNITVGNQAVKGAITQLKEDVKSILSGNFSGGGGLNATQIENVIKNYTLPRFLRKDVADEAKGHITFWQGLTALVKSFFNGIVNNGNIHNAGDITNSGNIMTKNLTVTGKATFFELEIQKAKAAGGMTVNSAGTFHIDAVEETADGFVCFQRAEKDGVTLSRTCEVNDQMMCSDGMNILKGGKGNHYYWRLVTDAPKEVVTRTIDGKEEKCLKLVLSKTDCSNPTDDKPKVGDELAQIGNREDKERQSVIMTCAYNSFDGDLKAPYWVQYGGVNDYKLSTHKLTWFAANGSQVTGNFKVRSAGGGLEPIEDYVKGLAQESYTRPNLLWGSDLNLDGVDVSDKAAVAKRLGVGLNATKVDNTEWFEYLKGGGVGGADALKFKAMKGTSEFAGLFWESAIGAARNLQLKPNTVYTLSAWVRTDFDAKAQGYAAFSFEAFKKEKEDSAQRVGRLKFKTANTWTEPINEWTRVSTSFTTEELKYGSVAMWTNGTKPCTLWLCLPKLEEGEVATPWCAYDDMDARKGKDAVTYKLVPMTENALAYMDGEDKQKLVDLQLVYKIQKTVGERVSLTTLKAEGMTLTVEPSFGEAFVDLGDIYDLGYSLSYDEENPVSSYAVTLKKGDDIVDRRVVPVTFKPKVAFDIDAANGEIRSDIANVRGDVNSFRKTINETSNTVGNLNKDFTRFKQTANELSLSVEGGARPNLLWGSDLNLDGVDVADKAAVSRRLGAGLVETRMDGGRFRYLKGEGVDGSDALMFRSEKGVARVVGLCFGATRELRVRPGSVCTMSAWVAFDSHGGQGSVFCDMESWNEAKGGFERVWATPIKADHQYDSKDVARWTRCRWTFRVGGSGRVRFYLCAFTDKSMCDLWLCRPKLEEGDKATPWREYDRTADLERAILDIKSGEITLDARKTTVKGDLTARSLRTTPATPGSPCVEIRDGEFSVMASGGRKGIEMSVDADGMPHLIFYDADGNPAYDLGHTGMRQLVDATVEARWLESRLMRDDGADAARVSHIGEADCQAYYTFRAAYNRKTGAKGSDAELDGVTFVEKSLSARRVPDGWYYPMNNGRLARVACLDAEMYGTREYRYAGGKLAEWRDVRIARDSRGGFQFVGAGACQGGQGQGGGGKSQPLTP